jgi:hypothetical protein
MHQITDILNQQILKQEIPHLLTRHLVQSSQVPTIPEYNLENGKSVVNFCINDHDNI